MKRFGIFSVLFLCACQMAMPLDEVIPREERSSVEIHKGRPIAYDSATVEIKRGTPYAVYPY